MSDRHTEGPWFAHGRFVGRSLDDHDIVSAAGGASITKEEADANARLIAASPALLEALECVMESLELCGETYGDMAKSRAAIALARGTA